MIWFYGEIYKLYHCTFSAMNQIKKILIALWGEKKYLAFLALGFQRFYSAHILGINYQDIYFLKKIIAEGDYCIDIGAHLGYYTVEMSRIVGNSGKVFAIEPMSKFQETLRGLLIKKRIANVELYQCALGGGAEFVDMGIPLIGNAKKYGYSRVMEASAYYTYVETEKVKNESGDALFAGLIKVNFIKCDVEGLEVAVFTSLMDTIAKHRPVLLCELADKNERIKLYEMLLPFNYEIFILRDGKLHHLHAGSDQRAISHNHYFIPGSALEKFSAHIQQQDFSKD